MTHRKLSVLALGLVAALAACARDASVAGVRAYRNLSRTHQAGEITYAQRPAVGGAHNPGWQDCGVYDSPVADELAAHSLEHGAVWIAYRADLPAADVRALSQFALGRSHVLVSPYAGDLPTPVVASAWGTQLQLARADDARLKQFVEKYEQGPQTPEPGAPCEGGVSRPTSP